MNKEEITRQQLEAVRDHLMIQYGSVLCLTLAFLLFVLTVFLVVFDCRRTALALYALIGALTFLVPTPVTFYLSPLVVLASVAGSVWLTIRERTMRRGLPVNASIEVPPRARSAAV